MKNRLSLYFSGFKNNIFVLTIVLVLIGLIALADVSAPEALRIFGDKFYFLKQQSISALLGIFLMAVVSKVNYKYWSKIAVPIFFVAIIGLVLVLIPGIGTSSLGARRWIVIGTSIQPSEIAKFALVIYFARVYVSQKPFKSYLVPLGLIGGLVMLQPDLGTTISIMMIGFTQIFISGINLIYILGAGSVGAIISAVLVLTSGYRRERLMTFLSQTQDPLGRGYHIRQILLALGSGGLTGVGLGQSRQKYLFLPEASTDSIFAVIAEELGFVGSSLLIGFYAFYIYSMLKVAKNAPDNFAKSIAVGIVAWIGGQAFLNIGSMVALIPLTGIPLPFFSYGGSSLVTILTAVGILVNISKSSHAKK